MSSTADPASTRKNDAQHQDLESSGYEKGDTGPGLSEHEEGSVQPFSDARSRKLLWKIDRTLLPLLSVLYLLSFLDRSNIGNARLAGLEADLGMTGKWDYAVSFAPNPMKILHVESLLTRGNPPRPRWQSSSLSMSLPKSRPISL